MKLRMSVKTKPIRKISGKITFFKKDHRDLIESFISSMRDDIKSREMVEAELGKPIRVTADWLKKEVVFYGPRGGKLLKMSDILKNKIK